MDIRENLSEFRYNPSSGDWVVIASSRLKRPHFKREKSQRTAYQKRENCPFCPQNISKQKPSLALFCQKQNKVFNFSWQEKRKKEICPDWKVVVIPNKYPALQNKPLKRRFLTRKEGVYQTIEGVGFHEVVVYRSHSKQINQFSEKDLEEAIKIWQVRFLSLEKEKNINYINFFTNFGRGAGASLEHPHSQIIAMPVFDPDISRSLNNSLVYYKKFGRCLHCQMIKQSLREGRRIILENKEFVALVPFAPVMDFEIRIYPKKHQSRFQDISSNQIPYFASILKGALTIIKKRLKNPDLNFFVHTSPVGRFSQRYSCYHWHLIILPRISVWGGFELGAGMQIISIFPEKAADFLKGKRKSLK